MNDQNNATGPGIHAGVQITAIVGGDSNRETRVPDSIARPAPCQRLEPPTAEGLVVARIARVAGSATGLNPGNNLRPNVNVSLATGQYSQMLQPNADLVFAGNNLGVRGCHLVDKRRNRDQGPDLIGRIDDRKHRTAHVRRPRRDVTN